MPLGYRSVLKMYSSLAHLWPVLNPIEEYSQEACRLRQLITSHLSSDGTPSMVEFGSGGGRLLSYFAGDFHTAAVDLSPDMILQSMKLNPSTRHTFGDMRTINLEQQFDVVLIADSIGYAVSQADLRLTIENGRAHLREGGVMILVPDWTQETFTGSNVWSRTAATDTGEVTLVEYQYLVNTLPRNLRSVFVFLIKDGRTTSIELDHHTFGLHTEAVWESTIETSGLLGKRVVYLENEYGLSGAAFVCTLDA